TGADVDDLESGSGLSIERVYPNPASRKITVDLIVSLEDVIDVDIVAVDGNIVKSFLLRQAVSPGSATLSFDLADLPRGRYSMLVRGRTATTSTSFVCE
ncbi:MAG: T9SS type A sorting domain-containing protein, partial [Candidatus Kapabacteria bacterium]|nr:T9SS type A sorting domain-containing protein [Candidatus Kapabacteria bacterium]